MPIFGANQGYSSNLPTSQIKTMRLQGMDNNQIIQALQRDGFSSTDIFDAMNQADMILADPSSQQNSQYSSQMEPVPPPPGMMSSPGFSDPGMMSGSMPPSGGSFGPQGDSFSGDSSTEELVEAIIDEKWNAFAKDMSKMIEWKNSVDIKVSQMEQQFRDMKQQFDKLHSAILGKIDDYDKNILNVGAEVKAMEKVFSKVLPVFTENVSELSRISKDMKKASLARK